VNAPVIANPIINITFDENNALMPEYQRYKTTRISTKKLINSNSRLRFDVSTKRLEKAKPELSIGVLAKTSNFQNSVRANSDMHSEVNVNDLVKVFTEAR